jgi:hypothetical protein
MLIALCQKPLLRPSKLLDLIRKHPIRFGAKDDVPYL